MTAQISQIRSLFKKVVCFWEKARNHLSDGFRWELTEVL